MKILMFGRGVISTLYGWALEGAGNTIDFYVRPGRANQLGSQVKLNIYDLRQKEEQNQHIHQNWTINLREDLPVDHDYDMIIVSVAHYRFSEVASFLSTRASRATILILNNFWEDPQAASVDLPQSQLAWGFPAAGGGFQPNSELYGALFPKLEFGTFGTEPTGREVVARKVFNDAGFAFGEHRNFREWLWVHFAVSAAVTAEQLRAGKPRRDIYENKDHSMEKAVRVVREVMPVLSARGIKIEDHPELSFFNQPEVTVAESLGKLLGSPAFQAAIDGHTNHEELVRMFSDVLEESHRLGIVVPLLDDAKRFLK